MSDAFLRDLNRARQLSDSVFLAHDRLALALVVAVVVGGTGWLLYLAQSGVCQ